jgi:transposase
VELLDMRAGVEKALARVVDVFGEARAHHAYLFVHKRANRMKVLMHDGFGLWLCARKLYEGSFIRAGVRYDRGMQLSHEQLQAIVVGLPCGSDSMSARGSEFLLGKKRGKLVLKSQEIWQYRAHGVVASAR